MIKSNIREILILLAKAASKESQNGIFIDCTDYSDIYKDLLENLPNYNFSIRKEHLGGSEEGNLLFIDCAKYHIDKEVDIFLYSKDNASYHDWKSRYSFYVPTIIYDIYNIDNILDDLSNLEEKYK